MHDNAELFDHLPEGFKKQNSIVVRLKDPASLIAPGSNMINGSVKFNADGSGHGEG